MASVWGNSWGVSWGLVWQPGAPVPPTPTVRSKEWGHKVRQRQTVELRRRKPAVIVDDGSLLLATHNEMVLPALAALVASGWLQ